MSAIESTLSIPAVYSPFQPGIHPDHLVIQERSSDWAHRWQIGSDSLRSHLVQHDIGTFAARVLPDGDPQVVQILAEFIIWLFGVDDGMCEHGPLGYHPGELSGSLSRLLRVAQAPHSLMLTDDPLAEGIRNLRRRLNHYATPGQLARWIGGIREYFLSLVWEAHHRRCDSMPDLNDYALIRLYNGAATAADPFLEIAQGFELSPHERHHAVVEALAEMAFFVIGWDNDIFSFNKEKRGAFYYLNAVRVVHAANAISQQAALNEVISHRDHVTAHFLHVQDRYSQELTARQVRYIRSLEAFIRGNQDWAITSRRYTDSSNFTDPSTQFSTVPTDDPANPPPIPAIQGWWQL